MLPWFAECHWYSSSEYCSEMIACNVNKRTTLAVFGIDRDSKRLEEEKERNKERQASKRLSVIRILYCCFFFLIFVSILRAENLWCRKTYRANHTKDKLSQRRQPTPTNQLVNFNLLLILDLVNFMAKSLEMCLILFNVLFFFLFSFSIIFFCFSFAIAVCHASLSLPLFLSIRSLRQHFFGCVTEFHWNWLVFTLTVCFYIMFVCKCWAWSVWTARVLSIQSSECLLWFCFSIFFFFAFLLLIVFFLLL